LLKFNLLKYLEQKSKTPMVSIKAIATVEAPFKMISEIPKETRERKVERPTSETILQVTLLNIMIQCDLDFDENKQSSK